jgi:threonine dehydratase
VAEGAGALALAAALRRDDRCICIVSGGNIDPDVLSRLLTGEQ